MPITREDDDLHSRTAELSWNESAWFSLAVPERGLCGYVYFYHRPNMNLSAGGPALWDPSGEDIHNCLFWDWNTCQAMPDDARMHDFALENGLVVRTVDLQRSYRMTYQNYGCEMDLLWTAFMEPVEMKGVGGEANPGITGFIDPGRNAVSVGHYQQFGRMQGTIDVEGERFEVDCYSCRDHSWGPRVVSKMPPRIGWLWAVASEDSNFFAVAASDLPASEDPVFGTVEQVVHGWYTQDGVRAELVAGERRVVERGPDGRPRRQILSATDSLGRTLEAEGASSNYLRWTGYSRMFSWWGLAEWRFGDEDAWGEGTDLMTFTQARRLSTLRRDTTVVTAL